MLVREFLKKMRTRLKLSPRQGRRRRTQSTIPQLTKAQVKLTELIEELNWQLLKRHGGEWFKRELTGELVEEIETSMQRIVFEHQSHIRGDSHTSSSYRLLDDAFELWDEAFDWEAVTVRMMSVDHLTPPT